MNPPILSRLPTVAIALFLWAASLSFHEPATPGSLFENALVDKVTFQVDTRGITVASSGMFIAGSFFSTIGYTNWTFLPMCDLGSGIWEISFVGIPPGLYQFKFVNGNAPPGWEFDGFGGPCTNALNNNNRFLNYAGGMHFEGPHCFNTCDIFCPGFSDPGVSDVIPPSIDEPAPANITLNCGTALPTPNPLAASDGCDANATTTTGPPTDNLSGLNACGLGDIIRTWTATDCAGNTSSVSQTITLIDTTAPVITVPLPPDSIFLSCGSNIPPAFQLPISDACDQTAIFTNVITDGAGMNPACGTGTVLRTWARTDCAGNTFSASQVMVFEDNTPPIITGPVPPNVTVECQNMPTANAIPASDNCNSAITSTGLPTDDLSGLGPCGTGVVIRNWSVTDCGGNTVSASQTITLTDNTPPTISGVPANVTVMCGNIPAAAALSASDFCDATVASTGLPSDDLSGINACGTGQIVRTWQVSDCSGNLASVSQTITVTDVLPPVITGAIPPGITVDCSIPLPDPTPLPAMDACDASVSSTGIPSDDFSGVSPCGTGQVVRTWQVADCSGNITSVSQFITLMDFGNPVILAAAIPPNVTVSCGNLPPPAALPASDACDQTVVFTGLPTDDLSGLGTCGSGIVIRTWTVTDCSGNSAFATQTITVADSSPPVITGAVPPNTSVECGSLPPAAALTASDDCDASLTTTGMPVDDASNLDACGLGNILRTWSATDCGGNTTSASQIITVTDATLPVLTIPANATYDCSSVPAATAGDASATDNCATPAVVYDGETVVGTSCPFELHRQWTATDCAGNSTSLIQIITVEDNEAPIFTSPPPDITVCVGDVPPMNDLGWTDNCLPPWGAGSGTVTGTEVSDGMTNPETITRTWTYSDDCGNEASYAQIITVSDSGMANAGPDQSVCEGEMVNLSATGASGAVSVLWTSSGDGSFNDENAAATSYSPGTGDLSAGSVTLTFTPNASSSCPILPDEMTVTFNPSPDASAGPDQTIDCQNDTLSLDGSGSSSGAGVSYQWSGPGITAANMSQQSPVVTLAGLYSLTVTLAGCEATSAVTVFQNTNPPTANAGPDHTLSCAQNSATLDGSGSAGAASLDFQWTGPGITAANASLPNPTVSEPGTYTLTVTDSANGCTATGEAEVTLDGGLPLADAGPDQTVNCNAATVTLDGSNSSSGPGINYQWAAPDGTPLGTAATQPATAGGTYTFTVTDTNNGCSITSTVEVAVDTMPPVADAGSDATLTCSQVAVVLGGSSSQGVNFSYVWTLGGNPAGTNDSLNATASGIYVLTVSNSVNGCTASDQAEVFENTAAPSASAGPDLTLDCSISSVTLDGSGSSTGPNFSYQWSGPGFNSGINSPSVSAAGTYVLTVTDTSNGCPASDSATVTADAGLPTADAGPDTALTCVVDEILLDGGNSSQGVDVNYAWTNSSGLTVGSTLSLTVTEPGAYTLTVSNTANGCSAFDEILVGIDTLAPVAYAGQDVEFTCTQTTATLDGSGSSTGNEFAYLWTGPGINGDPALLMAEAVETGTYTLTVSNLTNGCTETDEMVISQNADVPVADAGPDQDITCVVNSVILQGGASVPNAGFQWSGPGIDAGNATQPNPAVSQPGMYSLVVTDPATGCESPSAQVEVVADTVSPVAVIQPSAALDCQTNFIELDGSASTPSTLAFLWSSPFGGGTNVMYFANAAGIYSLVVTDITNGCTGSASVEVLDNSDPPVVTIAGNEQLTCVEATIQLSETSASLLPGIVLAWSTVGGNFTQSQLDLPEVELDAAGTYFITATDTTTGCIASDTLLVGADFEMPVITFDQDFEIGCMAAEVMLEANVTASSSGLGYEWSGPNFNSSEMMPSVSLPGTYELTATLLTNGCTASASTEVQLVSGISAVFFTVISPTCPGETDGVLQVDSVAGFNPPYQFSLNAGAFGAAQQFGNLAAGDYQLTALDSEGCEYAENFTIQEPSGVFVELGGDLEIQLGDSVWLSPVYPPTVNVFSWSNPEDLSCGDCPEPYAHPSETTAFTLTVTDGNGCQATDDVLIIVDPRLLVYAPNVFSPNGDGINDHFTLFSGGQIERLTKLQVFDRWGAQLFVATDIQPGIPALGWDGTHKGKAMGPGVYVFWAELLLLNGEVEILKGEVMLVK